jgi:superoxide dismutase
MINKKSKTRIHRSLKMLSLLNKKSKARTHLRTLVTSLEAKVRKPKKEIENSQIARIVMISSEYQDQVRNNNKTLPNKKTIQTWKSMRNLTRKKTLKKKIRKKILKQMNLRMKTTKFRTFSELTKTQ